jgi:hypothetical protein
MYQRTVTLTNSEFRADPGHALDFVTLDGATVEVRMTNVSSHEYLHETTRTVAALVPYARYLELTAIEGAVKRAPWLAAEKIPHSGIPPERLSEQALRKGHIS